MKRFKPLVLGIFFTRVRIITHTHDGKGNENIPNKEIIYYRKSPRDILLDSLIVGLIVFIASLPATSIPDPQNIYSAVRGFFYYFLAQIAIDRTMVSIVKRQLKGNNNEEGKKK